VSCKHSYRFEADLTTTGNFYNECADIEVMATFEPTGILARHSKMPRNAAPGLDRLERGNWKKLKKWQTQPDIQYA
jgi:hypothetical protein